MIDLSTGYLGMTLRSPLVASAGPLTEDFGTLLRLRDAGAGAVVLPSLFEEQITHQGLDLQAMLEGWADISPEAQGFGPEMHDYNMGPAAYLEYLEAAAGALEIPVIASLNGSSGGGWVRYARRMEEAGADAIELNVYHVAADADVSSAEVERRYLDLVAEVRRAVTIPVAVKVGPYFSSMAWMARRLVEAGADGLVVFNRFLQPDIDLETLTVVPTLHLSSSEELRLPLRWIAILRDQIGASLAATTGVHTPEDALKMILAGADAVMMTSALLKRGPEHLGHVLAGVASWLEERGYESVEQAKGSLSRKASPDPGAFERANYMRALVSYSSRFHS
jgi:dihydroorotate dehydrogenase (fumarate)